jgi:hypothetical protein
MGAGRAVAARTRIARHSLLLCGAVLGVLLVGMIMWSSAADAALVHPFIGTVAKSKKGFSEEVCGVSVDPASGEIFVSDPEPDNVQVFDKTGTYLPTRTISSVQVVEEESKTEAELREEKEKKEIEKGKTPKEVAGKFEKEELEEFCGTAVNDRNGDLYIADGGEAAIYPFDKEGNQVFDTNKEGKRIAGAEITGKETPAGEFGSELSIAIDQASGRMYVSDREHEAVDIFSEAGKYEGQLALPGSAELEHETGAVAVDQKTQEVYVAVQGEPFDEEVEGAFIYAFDSSGTFLHEIHGRPSGAFPGFGEDPRRFSITSTIGGLAVGPEGNVYASDTPRREVFEFDTAGDYLGSITGPPTAHFHEPYGVALNGSGDVYVIDHSEERNSEGREDGAPSENGALDEFGPAEVTGSPTIESESVSNLTATSATLHATVDPTGVETSYYFELCRDSSCRDVPSPPGTDIGKGELAVAVSEPATGLEPNTIYTYRLVATFGGGTSSVFGAAQSFTTTTEGTNVELPDGRAWELVSPPEKGGAGLESIPREGGLIESSESGNALTYISLAPIGKEPQGNRVPTFDQLLAKRGPDEKGKPNWLTSDITIPGEHATGAVTGEGKQEYRDFGPELEVSLVEPLGLSANAEPHLSATLDGTITDTERTIYTRQTEPCPAPPSICYTSIVSSANVSPGTKFGGLEGTQRGIKFVGATPDLSHVVLKSEVPLLTNEPANAVGNLYEWSAGQLRAVSVLPKVGAGPAEAAPGPRLGTEFLTRHAISKDGSRVIFTSGHDLYTRDMATGVTTQVDVTEKGEPAPESAATFQSANEEGTKILFTDTANLTALSSARGGLSQVPSTDLYEFDVLTGKVADLSVDPNFASAHEHAEVQGLVPGVSDDATTVYFVANGVLTNIPNAHGEMAQHGHCVGKLLAESALSGAECNLYVKQGDSEAEQPTFIGRLSQDDIPDWEFENGGNLEDVTDRVSPDGQYFAFMSDRSLTDYDNRDTNPAAHEARDEEVFLYNADTGKTICSSCDASGARPAGVFDLGSLGLGEEGIGLLIDRVETWEGKWLAGELPGWTGTEGQTAIYQSRYLSDSGRLFFNTTEALATADTNGKADVYEYEPGGVGGCQTEPGCTGLISSGSSPHESAFLDASTSGDDVFFLTAAALVSSDRDKDFDVYDARVCGADGCVVPPEAKPTSCGSIDECRPTSGFTPPFAPPASTTTPSSGNTSGQQGVLPSKTTQKPAVKKLTRAQQLTKALKQCKRLKKKKTRVACEKSARKKYGAKKKAKKSSRKTKGER